MKLTQQHVQAAIDAGLGITDDDSPTVVPIKHCAGIVLLRELLVNLSSGNLAIVSTVAQEPHEPTPTPPRKKTRKKRPAGKAR